MLGIADYKLNIIDNTSTLKNLFSLEGLVGKSINSYYVQWNTDENEWNEDGPIILIIDGF